MKKPSQAIPDRVVSVISDGVVIEVACDDDALEAVLVGLQGLLITLDVQVALMTIEPGAQEFAESPEAEAVRRSAVRN